MGYFLKQTLLFSLITTLFAACSERFDSNVILITMAPINNKLPNRLTGENCRYISQAQIAVVYTNRNDKSISVLTKGFYSACSPNVSDNGRFMLFAAQQKKDSTWQIWEMDLKKIKYRLVTKCKDNCTDPIYLPNNRLLFSQRIHNGTLGSCHALFTCELDGSAVKQVTFNPNANFASSVLNDGRIVTLSKQLYPYQKTQTYMVLRPDGTKAGLFYKGADSAVLLGPVRETRDGRVFFIESENIARARGCIIALHQNRPLSVPLNLTGAIKGSFCSVFPISDNKLLVGYRSSENKSYALYEFNLKEKDLGAPLYENQDFDVVDILFIKAHERAKKLPSEVDEDVKTGLILCQDICAVGPSPKKTLALKSTQIEILGIDTTYGIVRVEDDGSFYLKLMADRPFRIQALDEKGNILSGPCAWLWLRPNERRGCVGCHEGPEIAPENRVPLAVKNPPVTIPVHVSIINEKKVVLE